MSIPGEAAARLAAHQAALVVELVALLRDCMLSLPEDHPARVQVAERLERWKEAHNKALARAVTEGRTS